MTVKEIKKEIANLKATDKLHRDVVRDIVAESKYYNQGNSIYDIFARCEDVAHGCQTGIVGSLVYTSDCVAFFEKYRDEIESLYVEMMNECGIYSPAVMFREWDSEDPFVRGDNNRTILAWFAYEEINNRLFSIVEQYE
jgi:hypothetical protein